MTCLSSVFVAITYFFPSALTMAILVHVVIIIIYNPTPAVI